MANKSTSGRAAGKHKLQVHLLIGFLMTIVAIFGYSFFGPGARADNKTDLRQDHLIFNATLAAPASLEASQPGAAGITGAASTDYTTLQAEMDEFQDRVNSLNTGSGSVATTPVAPPTQASAPTNTPAAVQNPDKMASLLDQMIAMLNNLTSGQGAQTGTMATPVGGNGQ